MIHFWTRAGLFWTLLCALGMLNPLLAGRLAFEPSTTPSQEPLGPRRTTAVRLTFMPRNRYLLSFSKSVVSQHFIFRNGFRTGRLIAARGIDCHHLQVAPHAAAFQVALRAQDVASGYLHLRQRILGVRSHSNCPANSSTPGDGSSSLRLQSETKRNVCSVCARRSKERSNTNLA